MLKVGIAKKFPVFRYKMNSLAGNHPLLWMIITFQIKVGGGGGETTANSSECKVQSTE
jgi:hypothetical protein